MSKVLTYGTAFVVCLAGVLLLNRLTGFRFEGSPSTLGIVLHESLQLLTGAWMASVFSRKTWLLPVIGIVIVSSLAQTILDQAFAIAAVSQLHEFLVCLTGAIAFRIAHTKAHGAKPPAP